MCTVSQHLISQHSKSCYLKKLALSNKFERQLAMESLCWIHYCRSVRCLYKICQEKYRECCLGDLKATVCELKVKYDSVKSCDA